MLEEILSDEIERVLGQNRPPFDPKIDYEQIQKQQEQATGEWAAIGKEGQKEFGGKFEKFISSRAIPDLKSELYIPSKNYYLMSKETLLRIQHESKQLYLNISEIDVEGEVVDLIENLENSEKIRSLYTYKKLASVSRKNPGINTEECERIKNCMRQGRELFLSGKSSSLMVKPLNHFYSLTAYSYAVVILNNPIRYSVKNLPGSHGIDWNMDGIKTKFGGNMPHGTFSELMCSFPTIFTKNAKIALTQDCRDSIISLFNETITTGLGTLLSMVPEVRDYYLMATGKHSRTHPLQIEATNDTRSVKWEFRIGDGIIKPDEQSVKQAFAGYAIEEKNGKTIAIVPGSEIQNIKACIWTDARGNFWFLENPFFPIILPEICIHFLIINSFSNLMRYSPDRWGSILFNEAESNISLITRSYLSAYENKILFVLLRSMSQFYPAIVS